jgi:outer membrane protein, multidrug efflux system
MRARRAAMTGVWSLSRWVAGVALAAIGGCAVGPDFEAPGADAPAKWEGLTADKGAQVSVANEEPASLAQWWRSFNDPKLTALVEESITANLDLKLAEARLRQARAVRGIASAGLWPGVNASASYERATPGGAGAPSSGQDLYQAGLDAAWELDVFGGVRRSIESADADTDAAGEGVRAALVSVTAEVALAYVQLRGYQQQIVIAAGNLEAQRRTADITHKRRGVGFVSALDEANADAQVAVTASLIPLLEANVRQSIYSLSVLLARPPAALMHELSAPGALPITPPEVPVGMPSELARRRPDIRQAEAQLHAATAQIGVATADLFPKFSLTGALGWRNTDFTNWFSEAGRFWSVGPSVSWPVFAGGRIVASIHAQEALRDEAFIAYRKTVLTALAEVENALISFAKEQEHREVLRAAVAANRKAVDLSRRLYTEGQTDFLNVLDAQRSLLVTEDALVQSDRNVALDLIALYKALGGGWEQETPGKDQKS